MLVAEDIPMKDRRQTEQAGEQHDRDKPALDHIPMPLPKHPHEEIGTAQYADASIIDVIVGLVGQANSLAVCRGKP